MVVNELWNGAECMLLHQVVQSFCSCLLDMVMLWRQVSTSITACDTLYRTRQQHNSLFNNAETPLHTIQYLKATKILLQY